MSIALCSAVLGGHTAVASLLASKGCSLVDPCGTPSNKALLAPNRVLELPQIPLFLAASSEHSEFLEWLLSTTQPPTQQLIQAVQIAEASKNFSSADLLLAYSQRELQRPLSPVRAQEPSLNPPELSADKAYNSSTQSSLIQSEQSTAPTQAPSPAQEDAVVGPVASPPSSAQTTPPPAAPHATTPETHADPQKALQPVTPAQAARAPVSPAVFPAAPTSPPVPRAAAPLSTVPRTSRPSASSIVSESRLFESAGPKKIPARAQRLSLGGSSNALAQPWKGRSSAGSSRVETRRLLVVVVGDADSGKSNLRAAISWKRPTGAAGQWAKPPLPGRGERTIGCDSSIASFRHNDVNVDLVVHDLTGRLDTAPGLFRLFAPSALFLLVWKETDLLLRGYTAVRLRIRMWLLTIAARAPGAQLILVSTHSGSVARDRSELTTELRHQITAETDKQCTELGMSLVHTAVVDSVKYDGIDELRNAVLTAALARPPTLVPPTLSSLFDRLCEVHDKLSDHGPLFDFVQVRECASGVPDDTLVRLLEQLQDLGEILIVPATTPGATPSGLWLGPPSLARFYATVMRTLHERKATTIPQAELPQLLASAVSADSPTFAASCAGLLALALDSLCGSTISFQNGAPVLALPVVEDSTPSASPVAALTKISGELKSLREGEDYWCLRLTSSNIAFEPEGFVGATAACILQHSAAKERIALTALAWRRADFSVINETGSESVIFSLQALGSDATLCGHLAVKYFWKDSPNSLALRKFAKSAVENGLKKMCGNALSCTECGFSHSLHRLPFSISHNRSSF
eukprot:TRINITY_DN5205_c0_g1_i6.p1 TRINITY_DN5205_c0_g1~~TRINITY_DN5205_c0_g1_i6.p1  ORF type:complete len:806 (+),score=119.98 TRINITY_DN5205_c0_g1_i6:762-3179(+)